MPIVPYRGIHSFSHVLQRRLGFSGVPMTGFFFKTAKQSPTPSMYGIFLPTFVVDFYSKLVGKYSNTWMLWVMFEGWRCLKVEDGWCLNYVWYRAALLKAFALDIDWLLMLYLLRFDFRSAMSCIESATWEPHWSFRRRRTKTIIQISHRRYVLY